MRTRRIIAVNGPETCKSTSRIHPPRAGPQGAALRRVHAEVRSRQPLFLQCRCVSTMALPRRARPLLRRGRSRHRRSAFDMLFGPAYKGIPLVATTAASLYAGPRPEPPFAYNRKEAKTTAKAAASWADRLARPRVDHRRRDHRRTAIRESVEIIRASGATPAGVALHSIARSAAGTHRAMIWRVRGAGSLAACTASAVSAY